MKRTGFACLALVLICALALAGCNMLGPGAATTTGLGTTSAVGTGTTGTGIGTGTGTGTGTTMTGTTMSGSGTGTGAGTSAAGTGTGTGTGAQDISGATLMFNGTLYEVTDEKLRTDEVGVQVLVVSDEVNGTPSKDGEANGLDDGVRVYSIKEKTDMTALAVEYEGVFYRASKKA